MALWIGTSVDENFWQGWNRKVKTNVDDNGYAQATYGAGDISTNNPDYPVEAGWIDVESGSQIALVNDGNWRQPESSKFKLLLRTGHGDACRFCKFASRFSHDLEPFPVLRRCNKVLDGH